MYSGLEAGVVLLVVVDLLLTEGFCRTAFWLVLTSEAFTASLFTAVETDLLETEAPLTEAGLPVVPAPDPSDT